MFNKWNLNAAEYLKYFLISNNNNMVFETKEPGHNNITIGYEEYINKVAISLEKVRKVDVATKQ